MPFSVTSNFKVTSADPLDYRYGPYLTTDEATGSIDFRQRHLGLTVMITGSGTPQEYWFFPTTSSLNPKTGSGGTTTVDNNNDNYVLTGTGTGINAEQNLQFNGNVLAVTGSIFMSTGSSTSGITGSLFGTASSATTASFVRMIQGPGITINGMEITASVRTVNGVSPVDGNIAVSLSTTYVGFSSSLSGQPNLQSSASGDITASFGNGSLWVVIGETATERTGSNGQTFIYTSGSVGRWVLVPNASQAANDSRYVLKAGDSMTGNLTMSNNSKLLGTASAADVSYITLLSQSLQPNLNLGGITTADRFESGSSIEALLRELLITYVAGSVGNFNLQLGATDVLTTNLVSEVGTSLIFNKVNFSATADNPNNRLPFSASFTASGASGGNFDTRLADTLGTSNDISVGAQTVSRTSPGTVTFTLNARNPLNSSLFSPAKTRTNTYVYPIFLGLSSIDYFNNQSSILSQDADLTKQVVEKSNQSFNFGSTDDYGYIVFAFPSGSYGPLLQIVNQLGYIQSGAEISGGATSDYYKFDVSQTSTSPSWTQLYTIYQRKIQTNPVGTWNFKWTA